MWCLKMNKKESEYLERDKNLNRRIEEWSKTFKHKKVCRQYKLTKYCIHLAEAEKRKFGRESDTLDDFLVEVIVRNKEQPMRKSYISI